MIRREYVIKRGDFVGGAQTRLSFSSFSNRSLCQNSRLSAVYSHCNGKPTTDYSTALQHRPLQLPRCVPSTCSRHSSPRSPSQVRRKDLHSPTAKAAADAVTRRSHYYRFARRLYVLASLPYSFSSAAATIHQQSTDSL